MSDRMRRHWRLLLTGVVGLALVSCAARSAASSAASELSTWEPPESPPSFDTEPVLVNEEEVTREGWEAYPPELYAAGIEGRAEVWIRIDTVGRAASRHVRTSSGHEELDCAALQVGSAMKFQPVRDAGGPTVAWITRWIDFEPDPTHPPPPNRPRCEPVDSGPVLLNRAEVAEWMERLYPNAEKTAGVSGTVVMWIYIDESGRVTKSEVRESSGNSALDRAAGSAVRVMKFTPAKALGVPTAIWSAQRVSFISVPRASLRIRRFRSDLVDDS